MERNQVERGENSDISGLSWVQRLDWRDSQALYLIIWCDYGPIILQYLFANPSFPHCQFIARCTFPRLHPYSIHRKNKDFLTKLSKTGSMWSRHPMRTGSRRNWHGCSVVCGAVWSLLRLRVRRFPSRQKLSSRLNLFSFSRGPYQPTLSYQWVSQSPTEILCSIYTYPTPGVSVVCYVTVCQPAASNS